MKPKPKSILLLAVLLMAACSPLRRTQRNQQTDSTTVDRSEIRKAVHDILRESGTLSQTVVEFYRPVTAPPETEPEDDPSVELPPDEQPRLRPPAVKRIVRTEITTEREQTTTTDSTAHNDIHTNARSELSDKVAEKPPAVTATIRWIAIALAAVAAIILLLKIPKIKLPI
jgi:hypothetical protein